MNDTTDAGASEAKAALCGVPAPPERALRHQREKGAVRNPAKAGRSVLWELAV